MNQCIAVLGASGVYGRHLVPRLVARGHHVRALVRNPAKAEVARACGAELCAADLFDESSLYAGLAGCDVAINLATSLPNPGNTQPRDYTENDRLRREGTRVWVRACERAGVPRIVQQSIAMTHAGGGDTWADETSFHPLAGDDDFWSAVAAVRSMEQAITESSLDWLILRGALFYGPGTGFDDDWFSRARAGKLRLPGSGADFVSLVHVSDMAAATVAALERWPSRQALIIADDEPTPWRDLLSYVCALAGVPSPEPGARARMASFRVSNQRARKLLDWAPLYSSYRMGLIR